MSLDFSLRWYFAAGLVAAVLGHYVTRGVLLLYQSQPAGQDDGLRRAGTVIGILERIFTVTLVMMGQPAAVAILFAAKSIVRFNDARAARPFAEYYLIGTLTSILFALLAALAALRCAARLG